MDKHLRLSTLGLQWSIHVDPLVCVCNVLIAPPQYPHVIDARGAGMEPVQVLGAGVAGKPFSFTVSVAAQPGVL
jgi:hypothetical protein